MNLGAHALDRGIFAALFGGQRAGPFKPALTDPWEICGKPKPRSNALRDGLRDLRDKRQGLKQTDISQIDRLVGQAVRRRRVAIGLSVQDVARHCRISATSIERIEAGRARAQVRVLYDIADLLDVPVAGLFRESEGPASESNDAYDDRMQVTRAHYNALSVPHRRAIFAFLVASGPDRRDNLSEFA